MITWGEYVDFCKRAEEFDTKLRCLMPDRPDFYARVKHVSETTTMNLEEATWWCINHPERDEEGGDDAPVP